MACILHLHAKVCTHVLLVGILLEVWCPRGHCMLQRFFISATSCCVAWLGAHGIMAGIVLLAPLTNLHHVVNAQVGLGGHWVACKIPGQPQDKSRSN